MKILDANMILRYLLNDNTDMAEQVENLIEHNIVMVTPEVTAEVIYVMKNVYKAEKNDIVESLIGFIEMNNITAEHIDVIHKAILTYAENNLDFVDCVLYAYHKELGYEICTFDKKLKKLIENK